MEIHNQIPSEVKVFCLINCCCTLYLHVLLVPKVTAKPDFRAIIVQFGCFKQHSFLVFLSYTAAIPLLILFYPKKEDFIYESEYVLLPVSGNGRMYRMQNSGVCGKTPDVAAMQDLLVYVTRGISAVTTSSAQPGTGDQRQDQSSHHREPVHHHYQCQLSTKK